MILRFSIQNFLSFNERVEFDMFPNPKRERFLGHINTTQIVPILKQAAIYGANGSGKSNFIKAVSFLRDFIVTPNHLLNVDLDEYRFMLTNEVKTDISFEIEFNIFNKYYVYRTTIGETIFEGLYKSGLGEKGDEPIFERNGNEIKSTYLQNAEPTKQLLHKNPKSSLLPLNNQFPIINNSDVQDVYNWFLKMMYVVTIDSNAVNLIKLMVNNPDLLEFANEVFRKIGLGINRLDVEKTPLDEWVIKHKQIANTIDQKLNMKQIDTKTGLIGSRNNRDEFIVEQVEGKDVVMEFIFEQLGKNGIKKNMQITSQSDGTFRVLTLLPCIYDAMKLGKVIFIDEIENSIHPNLVYALIKLFSESYSNGQLIYTTHLTKLLNQQELIRTDEVWLTEKIDGETKMRSMNDFKIHNTINIENGYLEGRYGAVPLIAALS